MIESQGSDAGDVAVGRKFLSPMRILLRSYRISRDSWKAKHHTVQRKLEQERQLSAERGQSRDRWREQHEVASQQAKDACVRAEAADLLARQRLTELEQASERMAQLEADLLKKRGGRR